MANDETFEQKFCGLAVILIYFLQNLRCIMTLRQITPNGNCSKLQLVLS